MASLKLDVMQPNFEIVEESDLFKPFQSREFDLTTC